MAGLVVVVLGLGCGSEPPPADLVIVGGTIVTMVDQTPQVEALAARDGRVVAVGTVSEVRPYIGAETTVLELPDGALVTPGLADAHAHLWSLGRSQLQLDLAGAEGWGAIVRQVADATAAAEPGEWILGRGWHQEKWSERPADAVDGLPRHDELSAVSPDNPVMLTHASGHAVMVNARAMALAGIDGRTVAPEGGEIVLDAAGEPIGVLRENAEALVTEAMGVSWSEATVRRWAELAIATCLEHGLTSFHEAGTSVRQLRVLEQMADAGDLPIRLWVMLSDGDDEVAGAVESLSWRRHSDGFLVVGGVKRWLDGALGSHGAWLLEPYTDLPSSSGLATLAPEALRATARMAYANDLQLCVHAIGDRANRECLDVVAEIQAAHPEADDLRWRIEHAQHLHPDDHQRFGRLGVVASMQPTHCTSDGPWVPQRLGPERARTGAYRWRDLLDSGAVLAFGTDAPVEPIDPIATFHAAVSRRMADGERFVPSQRVSREEALRAMTWSAAYAGRLEDELGSLAVGKRADVTVLSANILEVPEAAIPATEVLYTVVDGVVRYASSQ
jgi:hypothetical protein